MKVLSVICARAGSKGLKNKCIEKIGQKMVIEYTIEYSLSLGEDVRTIVSTDINEVIDYCKKKNIEFIDRKMNLCTDESEIEDALADAINKTGSGVEYCSLAYGNVPTRYPHLFQNAFNFLEENKDYDAVISMQNVEKYNPEWMFDYVEDVLPKKKTLHYRRQMLPQKMIHDGHTTIFRVDKFMDKYNSKVDYDSEYQYSMFGDKIKPMINNEVIIDIDTLKDIKIADYFINGGNIK
jgi:CMP-N,N'-diacetyllegionaminic acid synthase